MSDSKKQGPRRRGGPTPEPPRPVPVIPKRANGVEPSAHLTGIDTLERVLDNGICPNDPEPEAAHQALLLWAMQDPHRRSVRAAATAVSHSESVGRVWATRWDWASRATREGEVVQQRACALYRELYLPTNGHAQVAVVERNMSIPLLTTGSPPTPSPFDPNGNVGDSQKQVLRDMSKGDDARMRAGMAFFEKARLGLEEVTGLWFDRLKTAEGRKEVLRSMRPGDIIRMAQEVQRLGEYLGIDINPNATAPGVAALEPSYRVTLAEKLGSPIDDALLADAEELVAIHKALRERNAVAREVAEQVRTGVAPGSVALRIVGRED